MSLELARDIWGELKHYLTETDQADAADVVVHMLIDYDFGIADISNVFKGEPNIKSALMSYADELVDEDEDNDNDNDNNADDYDSYNDEDQ